MVMVRIDGNGGSLFPTRKKAEEELKLFGFRPNACGWEKYLFTGKEVKVMTAKIEEVA